MLTKLIEQAARKGDLAFVRRSAIDSVVRECHIVGTTYDNISLRRISVGVGQGIGIHMHSEPSYSWFRRVTKTDTFAAKAEVNVRSSRYLDSMSSLISLDDNYLFLSRLLPQGAKGIMSGAFSEACEPVSWFKIPIYLVDVNVSNPFIRGIRYNNAILTVNTEHIGYRALDAVICCHIVFFGQEMKLMVLESPEKTFVLYNNGTMFTSRGNYVRKINRDRDLVRPTSFLV